MFNWLKCTIYPKYVLCKQQRKYNALKKKRSIILLFQIFLTIFKDSLSDVCFGKNEAIKQSSKNNLYSFVLINQS